jgi:Raf kinase inhibitor-like YbhB/YbcL family protein
MPILKKFYLESDTVKNEEMLPKAHAFNGFGCDGKNETPKITWKNAPKEAKSFALTVFDPDAPTRSGWWHWVVINIPSNVFSSESIPATALTIRNDYGNKKFDGACPPIGDKKHRYIFTVFTLKIEKIDIPEDSSPALASFMINQNIIEKGEIIAYYQR